LVILLGGAGQAFARQSPAAKAVVTGTVSTADGQIRLPGVLLRLSSPAGAAIGEAVSDDKGQYRIEAPRSGTYRLATEIQGFEPTEQTVDLTSGPPRVLNLGLRLVAFEQSIEVKPSSDHVVDVMTGLSPARTIDGRTLANSTVSAGDVGTELRWTPGVTPYGREWAIKGGRPNQIGLQVESAQVVDPAAGTSPVQLPGDAVNAIQILANPYAVEFGDFSSGLIIVSTRSGAARWFVSGNNFTPSFLLKRGANPFSVIGVRSIDPRLAFGGPLIKGRLSLAQSTQVRYSSGEVATRPQSDRRVSKSLSSFTRLDWLVNRRNTLTATIAIAPESTRAATLSTFDPPAATADLTQRVYRIGLSETAQLPHGMVLESLVHLARFESTVNGHGDASAMVLAPEQNGGIYYARQDRQSRVWQASETLSGVVASPLGQHLLRGGVQVMGAEFVGDYAFRPVDIVREDGTLADQQVASPSRLGFSATSAAAFFQDRWLAASRLEFEMGVRVERDGVFDRVNVIPRVGVAIALDDAKRATIRGGYGYFYDRTPLLAGAFAQQSPLVATTYGPDGQMLRPAVTYAHILGAQPQTARSIAWNIGYEHRLAAGLSVRVNHLQRSGSHELVLQTGQQGATGWIALASTGQSSYHDTEVGAHLQRGTWLDLDASYTRSSSVADLNDAFGYYLSLTANPVVRADGFGPTDTDTPNRLVVRGRAMAGARWAFELAGELRSGFPYSAVDQNLAFVGPRNSLRFPTSGVLDLSVERRLKIKKFQPWVGAAFINPLNLALPVDVQRNITSPAFGSFYRAAFRQIRITVHFHP
jgi:hypothetical protein